MFCKFKGQRLDNGKWVEGSLISYIKSADKKEIGSFILESDTVSFVDLKKNVFCSTDCYKVDPKTVQLLEEDKPKFTEEEIVLLCSAVINSVVNTSRELQDRLLALLENNKK